MAVYGVDFALTLYATHYFEAGSSKEASELARKLYDSDSFFDEHLLDEFRTYSMLPENMLDEIVFPADGFEPTLSTEEIAHYTDTE